MDYLQQDLTDTTPHPPNPVVEVGLPLVQVPPNTLTAIETVQPPSPTTDLEDPTTFGPADDTMGYDAYLQPALEDTTLHSSTSLKDTVTGALGHGMDTLQHLATPTVEGPNTFPDKETLVKKLKKEKQRRRVILYARS